MDEPGLLGVVEGLLELLALKPDIAADAFSATPRMRAASTEAMELGDEQRRAVETASGHLARRLLASRLTFADPLFVHVAEDVEQLA